MFFFVPTGGKGTKLCEVEMKCEDGRHCESDSNSTNSTVG